jgi:hypothetical protein
MRLGQSHKSRDVRYLGDADSYRTAQRAAGASIEQVEAEIAAYAALVESGDSIPTDAVEPVTGPSHLFRRVRRGGRTSRSVARLTEVEPLTWEHSRRAPVLDSESARPPATLLHRPQGRAALAQSAERLTRNEKVVGSIPTGGSEVLQRLR